MAKFMSTLITEEMLKDQYLETQDISLINSNDPIIILNPTEYTVKEEIEIEEEHDELSAFRKVAPD